MAWDHQDQLDEAARVAVSALRDVAANISAGVLLQEPEMNGAMASHLASAFRNASIRGVNWNCRHFKAIGTKAEENRTGADLVVSISIDLPGYKTEKGILIQNKRHGFSGSRERTRLLEQIDKMERLTCSSWVGVLSGTEIRFDSGETAKARGGRFSRPEARIPPLTFFKDFFQCKFGDTAITAKRAMELYEMSDESVNALTVTAKGDGKA